MNARRWSDLVGDETGLIAEEIAPGVTRLSEKIVCEAERSYFYLVRGRETDCLIDGGWGFCTSLGALRGEAEKPLVAVATHSHFDHIGLLHLAGRRYAHPAELPIYADPDPLATQALPYLDGRPVLVGGDAIDPASVRQTACPIDVPLRGRRGSRSRRQSTCGAPYARPLAGLAVAARHARPACCSAPTRFTTAISGTTFRAPTARPCWCRMSDLPKSISREPAPATVPS